MTELVSPIDEMYAAALALEGPDEELRWDDDPEIARAAILDGLIFDVTQTTLRAIGPLVKMSRDVARQTTSILQTAHADNSPVESWSYLACEQKLPKLFAREGARVGEHLRRIVAAKGFAFRGSISSVQEHDDMGSTVDNKYRAMALDVPVNLLAQQLGERQGRRTRAFAITTEQTDHARRLGGMTVLDLVTGQTTDEIDEEAANDSYHYLTPEQKAEIQVKEEVLVSGMVNLYTAAAASAKQSLRMATVIQAHAQGHVTTQEVQEMLDIYVRLPGLDKFHDALDFGGAIREARQRAVESGMLDQLLTPQEIMMRVGAELDEKYLKHPYIPLSVQDGTLTVEEARQKRADEAWICQNTSLVEYEYPFYIALAELDDEGNTLTSPPILSPETKDTFKIADESEAFVDHFKDMITMPFARPGDWYYKPTEA